MYIYVYNWNHVGFFIYVNMNKTEMPINLIIKLIFFLQLNADNGYSYLPFPFFARLDLGS